MSPDGFERLILKVLVGLGYGGSMGAALQTARSGDEGVDGVINEDALGLERVYVQAKRWRDTVSRPTVQGFVGSLEGFRADKGVIITTSRFSADAVDYAGRTGKRVVLIDGPRLASLMFDAGVGVTTSSAFEVKEIDTDFFVED